MKSVQLGSLAVAMFVFAGCSSGPKYTVVDNFIVPSTAKIGVIQQVACSQCTDPTDNPKAFTESLRSRLEELLKRPVTLVPAVRNVVFY